MPEPNLCRHCFSVLEEGETVCSACGQKPEAPNPDAALPLGTVLSGQYRVGMVLHHNDLLTTYLAWDAEKDRKVRVGLYKAEKFTGTLTSSEEGKVYWIPVEELKSKELATGMEYVLKIMESEQIGECYMHLEANGFVGDLY